MQSSYAELRVLFWFSCGATKTYGICTTAIMLGCMAEIVTYCIRNITKYWKSVSKKFYRHWNMQPKVTLKIA